LETNDHLSKLLPRSTGKCCY